MPRWLKLPRSRLPRSTAIGAALCVLLGLGVLTSIADLTSVPEAELRAANRSGQRVIVDPETGAISGLVRRTEEVPFEVSEEDSAPEPTVDAEEEPAPSATENPTVDAPALRTEAAAVTLPELASTRDSIVAPPAPEITELGREPLPKRGENHATASALYAKRFQRQEDMAYITLLITDAGFNAATLNQILTLPKEVTVAFSPYALDPAPQIALLHTAGYETWGMLPAQSARYPQDDPGPLGIIRGQDAKEQLKRLKRVMSATLGAVGLVLPPEEAITPYDDFAPVLKEIDTRGLFLLSTHPTRLLADITQDDALAPMMRRADLVLDSTESAAFIQSKLAGLPALARTQKKLIVLASARPQTLSLLRDWLASEPLGNGVALAPLSAMYGPDAPPPPPEAPAKDGGGHGSNGDAASTKDDHGGGH